MIVYLCFEIKNLNNCNICYCSRFILEHILWKSYEGTLTCIFKALEFCDLLKICHSFFIFWISTCIGFNLYLVFEHLMNRGCQFYCWSTRRRLPICRKLIFIVLVHWNNYPPKDMSSYSYTLSCSEPTAVFVLNAACLAEKQQLPILKKKPVISNTGNFFCFNNNVSNLYNNIVVEKTNGMTFNPTTTLNWFIDLYITNRLWISKKWKYYISLCTYARYIWLIAIVKYNTVIYMLAWASSLWYKMCT